MGLRQPELFQQAFCIRKFALPSEFSTWARSENWVAMDSEFKKLVERDGAFFRFLQTYHDFKSVEFIISIRDAQNDWEEDGIWHDDGTRVFAFSMSITENPETIQGGRLEMRVKGDEANPLIASIPTPSFGEVILFLTGVHGYEHRTRQVTYGRRMIMAGWCS